VADLEPLVLHGGRLRVLSGSVLRRATYVRLFPFDRSVFETSRIGLSSSAAAAALEAANSLDEAFLRAVERAAGAMERDDMRRYAQRLQEATRFAQNAAAAHRAVAATTRELAPVLQEFVRSAEALVALSSERPPESPALTRAAENRPLLDVLPEAALVTLLKAGYSWEEFRMEVRAERLGRDPSFTAPGRLAQILELAAGASGAFAEELDRFGALERLDFE
jgi:hypothetical protein